MVKQLQVLTMNDYTFIAISYLISGRKQEAMWTYVQIQQGGFYVRATSYWD